MLKTIFIIFIYHFLSLNPKCNIWYLIKVVNVFVLLNLNQLFPPIGDENVTTFVVTFMEILIFPNILLTLKVMYTTLPSKRCKNLSQVAHINGSLSFLGGLSLHLNHLIGSGVANYDWQFGTLPFGLFGSNLDTMDLETYPRTYSGHFWHMSLFDDFRAVWVFSKNGCSQKIKVFSMKERSLRGFAIQFSVQGSLG